MTDGFAVHHHYLPSHRRRISLAPVHLPDLAVGGIYFTCGGARWTVIESSQFALFARFLNGENITDVLKPCQAFGFNTLRVWTLYDVQDGTCGPRLIPSEHADFHDQMVAFMTLCARYGQYVEWTVFTGAARLMPTREQQQAHLDDCAMAIRTWQPYGALLEVGNEWNQGDNKWLLDLRWPTGVLASGGSVGADTWPSACGLPQLQYQVWHGNDAYEWPRKVGHEPMAVSLEQGGPCISNENTRYPDRAQSLNNARDAAASAALLCAGSCFHSVSGKTGTPWVGLELDAAQAWAGGALSVPLRFQAGAYEHDALDETAADFRVYRRRLPDGSYWQLAVRKQ